MSLFSTTLGLKDQLYFCMSKSQEPDKRGSIAHVQGELGPVFGIAVANTEDYLAIDAKELVERTADDYAQRLIDEGITRCQLIGYCLGGLLATEVARRLLERGIDVVDLSDDDVHCCNLHVQSHRI